MTIIGPLQTFIYFITLLLGYHLLFIYSYLLHSD